MRKINLLITTIILMAIMPFVMAVDSVNVALPVNGTNYTTTTLVSCTYTNETDITSPLSANSNWTYNLSGTDTVITHTGFVCSVTECNATVDLTALTDGIYTVKCTLGNATASGFSAGNSTNVMFDSTDPVCNIKVDHPTIPYKGIQDVEWDSSDGIELISTAVSIDGPQTQTTSSYTDANRILTLVSTDTPYVGTWTVTIGARDRVFNTCNDSITFESYLPNGDIAEGYGETTQGFNTRKIAIVVIIGIVGYLIFSKK